MRGPQLEDQLVLVAEIDRLLVLARMEIPEMQLATVFRTEQDLGDEAILERVRRAPLAGDERVISEMPPGVIGEALRPAVDLPAAEDVEGLVVHQEDSAGLLAIGVAEGGDVDPLRAAMHGMRTRVPGPLGHL